MGKSTQTESLPAIIILDISSFIMTLGLLNNVLEGFGSMIWKGGVIASGILAVGLGLLYAKQESLLYFPEVGGMARSNKQNPTGYRSPSEHSITFEEHMIACNYHQYSGTDNSGASVSMNGFIHSWLMLQNPDKALAYKFPTLVFFHGNAGYDGLIKDAVLLL